MGLDWKDLAGDFADAMKSRLGADALDKMKQLGLDPGVLLEQARSAARDWAAQQVAARTTRLGTRLLLGGAAAAVALVAAGIALRLPAVSWVGAGVLLSTIAARIGLAVFLRRATAWL